MRRTGKHANNREADERARQSAERAYAAGDFAKQAPAQQSVINPFPKDADHSSIDEAPVAANVKQAEPRIGQDGQYIYDDNVEDMFVHVGGYPSTVESEPKKHGWGRRLWNGLKGVGGFLKNATGYNLIRHGLFGANFRRGKVKKNAAKVDELRAQIAQAEPGTENMRQLQTQFNVADHKLFTNQVKLGKHRQYYTGRKMANEFTSLFKGRDMEMRDGLKHFFTGGASPVEDPLAPLPAQPNPDQTQVQAEGQVQEPAKLEEPNDDWNVAKAQQQYRQQSDLMYDDASLRKSALAEEDAFVRKASLSSVDNSAGPLPYRRSSTQDCTRTEAGFNSHMNQRAEGS